MITVVNRKTYRGECIYIGRPSLLGNPFVIGRDGSREEVIRKYRRWLWNEIRRGVGPVFEELHRLAHLAQECELVIGCWCVPQSCHGSVIKACLEWLNSSDRN